MKTIIAFISQEEDTEKIVSTFRSLGYLLNYQFQVKPNEDYILHTYSQTGIWEYSNIKVPNNSSIDKMIIAFRSQDPDQPEITKLPKLEQGNKATYLISDDGDSAVKKDSKIRLFKSVDDRLKELGFEKKNPDNEFGVSYTKRYSDYDYYVQHLDILYKKSGRHVIQSYEKPINISGDTNAVGLTYEETKLAMKKYRQLRRKYKWSQKVQREVIKCKL